MKKYLDVGCFLCFIISMNQYHIAKKLKIDRSYLNGILNGKRVPSRKLAKEIAKVTGRSWLEFRKCDRDLLRELL